MPTFEAVNEQRDKESCNTWNGTVAKLKAEEGLKTKQKAWADLLTRKELLIRNQKMISKELEGLERELCFAEGCIETLSYILAPNGPDPAIGIGLNSSDKKEV